MAKVFDTHQSSVAFDAFVDEHIPDGYIIAAACKDTCAEHLSAKGVRWFQNMGSNRIQHVKYRMGFAFVGLMGYTWECRKQYHADSRAITNTLFGFNRYV